MIGVEEAVCRKHVGIARRSDLAVVPLRGNAPVLGRAVRVGAAWHARVGPVRVLVIEPGSSPDVVISIVGPRGSGLLDRAGLPTGLAPGDVRVCWWGGEFVVLLRENVERHLLLASEAAWDALLVAGRELEVACVSVAALARLHAASLQQQRA
jgi:hypothetical protein